MTTYSRREFIKKSMGAAACLSIPSIVPASVLGDDAPSKKINVGMIGTGRQAYQVNIPQFLKMKGVRIAAVCDVDQWRLDNAYRRPWKL